MVAKEEQVHHLDRTGQGPGDTQHARYFVFAAWILLSLFFLFFFPDHNKSKRNGKAFSKIGFSNDSPSATKSKQVACM